MQLLFLGEPYQVISQNNGKSRIDFGEQFILVHEKHNTPEKLKNEIIKLYKKHFIQIITEEITTYTNAYSVSVNTVRIKKLKSRWGSCSSLNNLNFNLNLMLAPRHIIRYVVIHEVCHLIHLNHSRAFWETVTLKCPTWQEDRLWLRKNGHFLSLDYQIS